MVTAGTVSVFGQIITNPTEIVARVGQLSINNYSGISNNCSYNWN